jgi:hypothetical protein
MDNRERLKNYLRGVARVFNNNGPKIKFEKQANDYTTFDYTEQQIDNLINKLIDRFKYNQIKNALNSPTQLDDIAIMLIRQITQNSNEPLWSIVEYQGRQYFIPPDEAVEKYSIKSEGPNGNFLYPDFEIQPLQPPKNSFFQGGKKSKRKRRTKSTFSTFKKSYAKRRVKQRTKRRTK